MSTKIHVVPTDYYGHSRVGTHSYEEERSVLQGRVVVDRDKYCKPCDRHTNAEDGEPEAMHEVIRQRRDEHTVAKRGSPWWNGVQLRLDWVVAVALNYAGSKVGIAVCWNDQAEVLEVINSSAIDRYALLEDECKFLASLSEGSQH